jgi:hypothetical protein
MLAAFLASMTLFQPPIALPAATPLTGSCFGPCVVPGCSNSDFWVCHETPGQTTILGKSGGAKVTSTQSNSSTAGVGVLGATIFPDSDWGDTDECSDISGSC